MKENIRPSRMLIEPLEIFQILDIRQLKHVTSFTHENTYGNMLFNNKLHLTIQKNVGY